MKHLISCVWAGDAYEEKYVTRLYKAIKRNTTKPFDFCVIGDNKPSNPEFLWWGPLDIYPKWWSKLQLFNPYFIQHNRCAGYTHNLYFDLDTMIVKNIDAMFYIGEPFSILQNFLQPPIRNPNVTPCLFGSAVMTFSYQYTLPDIWKTFTNNPEYHMKKFERDGDQYFIEKHLGVVDGQRIDGSTCSYLQHYFESPNYFRSIKYPEPLDSVPEGCRVLCYHGDRKMHKETETALVKTYWID